MGSNKLHLRPFYLAGGSVCIIFQEVFIAGIFDCCFASPCKWCAQSLLTLSLHSSRERANFSWMKLASKDFRFPYELLTCSQLCILFPAFSLVTSRDSWAWFANNICAYPYPHECFKCGALYVYWSLWPMRSHA